MYKIYVYDKFPIISIGLKAILGEIINIDIISIIDVEKFSEINDIQENNIFFIEISNNGNLDTSILYKLRNDFPKIKIILFTDYEIIGDLENIATKIHSCSVLSKSSSFEKIFDTVIRNLYSK